MRSLPSAVIPGLPRYWRQFGPRIAPHSTCATAGLRCIAAGLGRRRRGRIRCGSGSRRCSLRRPDYVLIHDGARPFPDAALIGRVIDGLGRAPAAIPCLPLSDTVKRVEDGAITGTVDRDRLWRAQTPQGFHFGPILEAHRAAAGQALTDDAAVAEWAGMAAIVVAGSEANIKVTTPEDLGRGRTAAGRAAGRYPGRPGL